MATLKKNVNIVKMTTAYIKKPTGGIHRQLILRIPSAFAAQFEDGEEFLIEVSDGVVTYKRCRLSREVDHDKDQNN